MLRPLAAIVETRKLLPAFSLDQYSHPSLYDEYVFKNSRINNRMACLSYGELNVTILAFIISEILIKKITLYSLKLGSLYFY